jgi:hypothetical protein
LDIGDGILTNILIKRGIAREANPYLLDIAGESGFLVLKVVGVLMAAAILWDIHRRYPRVAFWTAFVFLLVYCGIVAWNGRLLMMGP